MYQKQTKQNNIESKTQYITFTTIL